MNIGRLVDVPGNAISSRFRSLVTHCQAQHTHTRLSFVDEVLISIELTKSLQRPEPESFGLALAKRDAQVFMEMNNNLIPRHRPQADLMCSSLAWQGVLRSKHRVEGASQNCHVYHLLARIGAWTTFAEACK